jgi:serine-type D-Ala-D-Ala carboxypeptidase/endopeptidase (penicillin-binding protein 4)
LIRKRLLFFVIILFFYQGISVKAIENQADFTQKLNLLIKNETDLNGALAGISIRSASNGMLLYDHFGDIRLRPASNMKLLTSAVALSVLGEKHRFQTDLYTDGVIEQNTLKGDLFLKGKGDPTLLKSDLKLMAIELQKSGIKKINGNLVGDPTWFDDTPYPIDMPWSDETYDYGAPISALTMSPNKDYDEGSIIVDVIPDKKIGEKAKIKITPTYKKMKIVNQTKIVSKNEKKKVVIERRHAKNIVFVKGTIPINTKKMRETIAVWDPNLYALDQFKQVLRTNGIRLEGKVKKGVVPNDSKLLMDHDSIPLSDLLIPFMKLSNNGHAETLIKEMGKVQNGVGSWKKGLQVMRAELPKFGVDPDTMILRDGSGISHVDCIPANQLSYLLYSIQKEKWFPSYLQSLPVSGMNERMVGGSLRNRLKSPIVKGKVRAKTGTLTSVSSLSGYVETKSGQTLIFSILLNNMLDETKGKKIEDKIVLLLANQ